MGLKVRDVLQMTKSQHLMPGNVNAEEVAYQNGAILAGATSMTLDAAVAIPDLEIVEWDDDTFEVALVKDQTGTTVNFASRGYLDTAGEAHADDTRIIVGPSYTKKVLYDGLQAVISQLRGYGLYLQVFTSALTINTTTPTALPAGATGISSIIYQNGSNWFPLGTNDYRILYNYSAVGTHAIQFFTGITGATARIVYKKDYTLPEDVTLGGGETVFDVDLEDDCSIPAALTHALPLGVAAHVLTGRDIPSVDSEHIRRSQLTSQVPVGTRTSLSRTLQSRFLEAVQAERYKLLEANPVTVSYTAF